MYKNKRARYILQNNRKFNIKHLKALKAKEYVVKSQNRVLIFKIDCIYQVLISHTVIKT